MTCLLGDGQLLLAPEGEQVEAKEEGLVSQQTGTRGTDTSPTFCMHQLAFRLLLIVTVHLGITLGPHRLHRLLMSLASAVTSSYRHFSSYLSSFTIAGTATIITDGREAGEADHDNNNGQGGEEETVKVSRCQAALQLLLWLVVHMSLLRLIVSSSAD